MQPEGAASDSERAEEDCGAGIPACTEGAAFARLERMQPGWLQQCRTWHPTVDALGAAGGRCVELHVEDTGHESPADPEIKEPLHHWPAEVLGS